MIDALFVGTDGIIIVDSTESGQACVDVFKEFRKITSKPLKAIIISHFHAGNFMLIIMIVLQGKIVRNQKINRMMLVD